RINFVEPVSCPMAMAFGGEHRDLALGHIGYFAELIDEWAPESHADERLCRLGATVADALAAGAPVERLARYFEYWILRLQGVYPAVTTCPGCGAAFDGLAVIL